MTNKERLFQDTTTLEYLLTGDFWGVNIDGNVRLCKRLDCRSCKFNTERTCACQREEWLKEKYLAPLLFPIGTSVEVDDNDSRRMGYYNGFENDNHYVVIYKQHIGYRYKDGELYGSRCKANQLRKVGD